MTDTHAAQISTQIERALADFVCEAVSRLQTTTIDPAPQVNSAPRFGVGYRYERSPDGHFHQRKRRILILWPILASDWLCSLPSYQTCVECLKSDKVVGPHLDRLVGTYWTAFRVEAKYILASLIYAMVDDEGRLTFTYEKFCSKWRELANFFASNRITVKTVVPLQYLVVPTFPLPLNDELVLDRLTDDEVTRCYNSGVIRTNIPQFSLIDSGITVGIRRTSFLRKVIRQGDDSHEPPEAETEGSFGRRSFFRDDLTIDDILSALRLLKHTRIRAVGVARWTEIPLWLNLLVDEGTLGRVLGPWPQGEKFELTTDDVPRFLELWHLLEKEADDLKFSIRRFNFAFDRGLLADRIVDLVIAAEALFLGDLNKQDRGELRYRFALRAAKFIECTSYSEHDIFRIMRQAYDARSAVVHGSSPKNAYSLGNQSADLPTFIEAIENLVRLGLRKALSMKKKGRTIDKSEYWDTLVFPKADSD